MSATAGRTLGSDSSPPPNWRALRFFNAYRLSLAALLLAMHALSGPLEQLDLPRADSFMLMAGVYGVAAFVLLTLDELRLGGYTLRLQLGLTLDILALGLLGFSGSNAHENIHMLLVANMAYASLLLGGREALAFAALGSVWLLILASLEAQVAERADVLFTHAGGVGMALFAVAILARTLARRLEASQRLAEQRGIDLANETQLNRLILERTEEGVLIVDGDDQVRHANRAALRLLHCDQAPAEVQKGDAMPGASPAGGRTLTEISPELASAVELWRLHPEEALTSFRIEHPTRIQVRISPLDRAPHGAIALFLQDDASLMEQLQQAKLAALGRLTAGIAHEIRNPLSAIGHAGQLLEEGLHEPQERQLLEIIRKQVRRIDRIVEEILVTSRRKQARPAPVALAPWLEAFLHHYRSLHAEAAPQIELQAAANPTVMVDPDHLEQILTILLDNALRHGQGPDGTPYVRVELKLLGPRQQPVLDVVDRGAGVSPEAREHLFEPFFTTSPQGHGLGLFVARELAEANRIGLHHHPEEQGGSRFRLSFPRQEPKT